jgi:hypothetical protein
MGNAVNLKLLHSAFSTGAYLFEIICDKSIDSIKAMFMYSVHLLSAVLTRPSIYLIIGSSNLPAQKHRLERIV